MWYISNYGFNISIVCIILYYYCILLNLLHWTFSTSLKKLTFFGGWGVLIVHVIKKFKLKLN